ncbi:MAG: ATP-binding cassette domain-containing protein [Planctomycetota bacterium]|jgi:ABC-type ATPase with predicted acetyltransferase domain
MGSHAGRPQHSIRVNARIRRGRPRTAEARRLADIFGLQDGLEEALYDGFELTLRAGEISAVVGPSGGGKSVLLRHAMDQAEDGVWMDVASLADSSSPAISTMPNNAANGGDPIDLLARRMALLAQCGLAEPAALITPAGKLSAGQLWRLALARALWQARQLAQNGRRDRPVVIVADEFAAALDWPTGTVLCRHIRNLVRRFRAAMIVATHRWDLLDALQPDRLIVKPLGGPARYDAPRQWLPPGYSCNGRRWRIRRGSIEDYKALGRFHYLTGPPAAHKRVVAIPAPRMHRPHGGPAIAAVAVVSPPVLQCRGRNMAVPRRYCSPPRRQAVARLNAEVETISRVIVHPIYRGIGLARRLVRHILTTSPMAMVEALAVMGRYHPFFAQSGMTPLVDKTFPYVYYSYATDGRSVASEAPAR